MMNTSTQITNHELTCFSTLQCREIDHDDGLKQPHEFIINLLLLLLQIMISRPLSSLIICAHSERQGVFTIRDISPNINVQYQNQSWPWKYICCFCSGSTATAYVQDGKCIQLLLTILSIGNWKSHKFLKDQWIQQKQNNLSTNFISKLKLIFKYKQSLFTVHWAWHQGITQ